MPRPKSELTTTQKRIGTRLTQWQYEEWKRIGSTKWLKQLLTESYKKRISHDTRSIEVGA
jgi:Txe/YoeB family toxin of Txe-Axe toxin-antitoxin module